MIKEVLTGVYGWKVQPGENPGGFNSTGMQLTLVKKLKGRSSIRMDLQAAG
jgi:hypothetical protein